LGVFSGLEESLEKCIEGFIKDNSGSKIHPVDIAKKLAREMRDGRRVSVRNIYVPNEYTVHLNKSDWESVSHFSALLSRELQEYLRKKAEERKYTLAGPPVVKFSPDENLAGGKIRLESRFSEAPPDEGSALEEEEMEHTQRYLPVKEIIRAGVVPQVYGRLRVDGGPDKGKTFDLTAVSVILGRRADCDVVLNDSSVSRRHARLDFYRGRFTITDLESTNGTRVNGVRINSKALEPEDVISLGTTTCTLRVE